MKQELEKQETKNKANNVMRKIKISKVTLSAGATGSDLEKASKLLEMIGNMKAQIIKSGPKRRIPSFGVKPRMPLGARITIRGKKSVELLGKMLGAVENTLKKKQIENNTFSFGIKEYIEISGIEYVREIGIRGFNVTVSFERSGIRVKKRKIKRGKFPKRQGITKEEIIKFMEENFKTSFV